MVNCKKTDRKIIRKIVAAVSKSMVRAANGTASTNFNYQPKKPFSSIK